MLASTNVMEFNVDGVWAGVLCPWRTEEPQATKDNWKNKALFTKSLGPAGQLPIGTMNSCNSLSFVHLDSRKDFCLHSLKWTNHTSSSLGGNLLGLSFPKRSQIFPDGLSEKGQKQLVFFC